MSNIFGYMRISTREERELQTYNRQISALNKYANNNNIEYTIIFKESISGKNFNRPEWKKLESIIKTGDTIVFKDISRFTRECKNGFNKYNELMKKGINLIFIDNPTVSTDYIKNLLNIAEEQSIVAKTSLENTVKLLLIVELDRIEQERLTIIKRIKDGLKASGKKSGRKEGSILKLNDYLKQDIIKYLNNRNIKGIDIMNKYNISRNTLKKYAVIIQKEIENK